MPEVTGLVGWLLDLVARFGPVGLGIAVAAETIVPPVPSELILPVAGFLAGRGELSLVGAVAGATAGSLVGALAAYWVGAATGRARVGRLWARVPFSEPRDLERADAWFRDHQGRAVFIGRFVPVVRSLVSVPAGVARMPLARFVVLTALGSGIWNATFIGLGYQLGARWRQVGEYSGALNVVTLVAIVAVTAVAAGRRIVRRRRDRELD